MPDPEFKAREEAQEARKQAALMPFIKPALARKSWMAPIPPADIPLAESYGRRGGGRAEEVTTTFASDPGGAISIPAVAAAIPAAQPVLCLDAVANLQGLAVYKPGTSV